MVSCTLASAVLSDYLSDRAQCLANVLALVKQKTESFQIGPAETSHYVQALRSVSDHIMRNSKVVSSAFGLPDSSSALQSNPAAAEKMKQFLASVNSIDKIEPWTVVLRMRDLLEATIRRLLTQPVYEPNSFATSQVQAWRSLMESERLKELLLQAMSVPEIKELRGISTTVLQYEMAFSESALARNEQSVPELGKAKENPWHPSNIIFTTDYDVTCTVFDSCYFMLQGNEAFMPGMARYEARQLEIYSSFEETESDHPTYWREREQNENHFLLGFDPSLQPMSEFFFEESIEEISVLYDEAGLRKALVKLANLEEICNWDIMSVGFLKGAAREEIRARAKKVPLRPKCAEVLQQLTQAGTGVHLVSANWSRDIILGGLPELPKDKLLVHCNELHFDSAGVAYGTFDNTCVDAFDKEKMLRLLRRFPSSTTVSTDESAQTSAQQQLERRSNEQGKKMLVFLGDSPTDLLGLLEADLGIVFGDSPRLRRLLSLHNIQLLPLTAATAHIVVARSCGSNWSCRRSGILFEAQGWDDVEACLFGEVEISELRSSLPLSSQIEKLIEDAQSQPPQKQQPVEFEGRSRDLITPISLDMIRVSS